MARLPVYAGALAPEQRAKNFSRTSLTHVCVSLLAYDCCVLSLGLSGCVSAFGLLCLLSHAPTDTLRVILRQILANSDSKRIFLFLYGCPDTHTRTHSLSHTVHDRKHTLAPLTCSFF